MNKVKLGLLTVLFCATPISFAAECYVTLVKADCWKGYQVDLNITKSDGKVVGKILIPKDKTWGRIDFPCNAGDVLASDISFDPPIWKHQVGLRFKSKRFWNLPATEADKGTLFAINMCFPGEFAQIPQAPNANTSCDCSMEGIPPVENLNIAK
jgi:hypothetical protein